MMSPLDAWLGEQTKRHPLTVESLRQWQMRRLKKVVDWCIERSPFYQKHLGDLPEMPEQFTPISYAYLPFMETAHVREYAQDMLCIAPKEFERVVSLNPSGNAGKPKQFYFTSEDIESTLEFFQVGLSGIVKPGEVALITLPGSAFSCAAELLTRALPALGACCLLSAEPFSPSDITRIIEKHKVSCLLSLPSQLRVLMDDRQAAGALFSHVKKVMLTGELVDIKLRRRAKRLKMELFDHYGLTETCLGGGMECLAHDGYHLREADLYFEIVDPQSGLPVALGQAGEVVVSTLSRFGMPLLRYRTGDYASLMPGQCACGSPLARLSPLAGRVSREMGVFTVDYAQKGHHEQYARTA